jgi:hypothetical protein
MPRPRFRPGKCDVMNGSPATPLTSSGRTQPLGRKRRTWRSASETGAPGDFLEG